MHTVLIIVLISLLSDFSCQLLLKNSINFHRTNLSMKAIHLQLYLPHIISWFIENFKAFSKKFDYRSICFCKSRSRCRSSSGNTTLSFWLCRGLTRITSLKKIQFHEYWDKTVNVLVSIWTMHSWNMQNDERWHLSRSGQILIIQPYIFKSLRCFESLNLSICCGLQ